MKLSELIAEINEEVTIGLDVLNVQKTKMGTKVTVGVAGDIVFPIANGEKIVLLLVMDKSKVDEAKKNFLNSTAGQA